ncbi:ATP-grasp domain-containing protein [Comamonas terrigena]|uniref:ATP-grasp domain-containing protein n=1 Tax=Comamonas terrigena TaxID=32013 RepID=UPI002448DBCB|nr:ATP-grasp domain-containing protein [Comamonas terrigena]MDH0050807.1 ATP-grasp domain-containing protein [Comamonas terrigena]MDH0513209.1 ATP-grasp domain-containing protein [Comamonas terrigena]MDH1093142.1 ATP-grasp domain-containing protein [Comamonas terrigena]MDH1292258.1 ATP-grasp domain-containing protein [Comamonas terrigena]MDH1500620.1 ATP-grasp domain-containing protein [Comamonas terrigena]
MSKKLKVLVFPCGSENATEIHSALRYSVHVDIYGASSIEDHGRYTFEKYIGDLPNISEKNFDEVFSHLISKLHIDIIFATHDTVHEYLSTRSSTMGFHLVNGDQKSAIIARKKSLTYELFSDLPWAPIVFKDPSYITDWPVIAKPDCGQGGQGVKLVHSLDDAKKIESTIQDPVWMEYLTGDEITVDCFTDRNRNLLWVGPRTRERIKAGISMRSTFLPPTESIREIATTINQRVTFRGPWFFQLKKDNFSQWKLLEFSCRVAGTMVSQRAKGINLPLMTIQDFLNRNLTTLPNKFIRLIDRKISTRAELNFDYEKVYIDLDETLIINNKAVPTVLSFVYQSIANGKKIILITRHTRDIKKSLASAKICIDIFDEIIHVKDGSYKSIFIHGKSIFIDNHFPERLDVALQKKIPTLDVDTLEFFIK